MTSSERNDVDKQRPNRCHEAYPKERRGIDALFTTVTEGRKRLPGKESTNKASRRSWVVKFARSSVWTAVGISSASMSEISK